MRPTAASVSRNASRVTFSTLPVAIGLAIAMSFTLPAMAATRRDRRACLSDRSDRLGQQVAYLTRNRM